MKRAGVILTIGVWLGVAQSVFGESTEEWIRRDMLIDPYQTGETITREVVSGHWNNRGLEGQYRIVVANAEAGADKLYVQWLRKGENDEIAYSLAIRELNEIPSYKIRSILCDEKPQCASYSIEATHIHENTSHVFFLHLHRLGVYSFGVKPVKTDHQQAQLN